MTYSPGRRSSPRARGSNAAIREFSPGDEAGAAWMAAIVWLHRTVLPLPPIERLALTAEDDSQFVKGSNHG